MNLADAPIPAPCHGRSLSFRPAPSKWWTNSPAMALQACVKPFGTSSRTTLITTSTKQP